jgi:cytochrome c oxidase subunit 2
MPRRSRPLFALLVSVVPAAALFAAAAQEPEPRVIEITARRFSFEPSEVQVSVGERVRLLVRSADGVHGLEIKKFKVNKEIPRGSTPVAIEFTASEEGRFPIACSEYCGKDHDAMTGLLIVSASQPPPRAVDPGALRRDVSPKPAGRRRTTD